MIEIRFHGRGGQGAVVASNILADAAFREGKYVQAFPYFGVERRGAPVTSFTRIDKNPIKIKSQVYNPNYIVVLDPTLMDVTDVTSGLNKDGVVLINSDKDPKYYNLSFKTATVESELPSSMKVTWIWQSGIFSLRTLSTKFCKDESSFLTAQIISITLDIY